MRVGITVESRTMSVGVHELWRRLATEPALRGRIRADTRPQVLLAVLEPGEVTEAFAGSLVAWLAARRECSVSLTRADGTRIVLTSAIVRRFTFLERAAFVRDLGTVLDAAAAREAEAAAREAGAGAGAEADGGDRVR
ncbi:effector-associated constant component EACC1 [Streptomyces sp. enrichment culture]|uniref:effector-associated constant component EACC1 n=1 Tax=Streptomyces sp. enrichment culture TaxID=1795815 RepID=UPI003F57B490